MSENFRPQVVSCSGSGSNSNSNSSFDSSSFSDYGNGNSQSQKSHNQESSTLLPHNHNQNPEPPTPTPISSPKAPKPKSAKDGTPHPEDFDDHDNIWRLTWLAIHNPDLNDLPADEQKFYSNHLCKCGQVAIAEFDLRPVCSGCAPRCYKHPDSPAVDRNYDYDLICKQCSDKDQESLPRRARGVIPDNSGQDSCHNPDVKDTPYSNPLCKCGEVAISQFDRTAFCSRCAPRCDKHPDTPAIDRTYDRILVCKQCSDDICQETLPNIASVPVNQPLASGEQPSPCPPPPSHDPVVEEQYANATTNTMTFNDNDFVAISSE